jgi:F0F1-type ATP synthase alpha subunit
MKTHQREVLAMIMDKKELNEEIKTALNNAIKEFKASFK